MVVLASESPQRKTLLEQIGIRPVVIPADINEEPKVLHIADSLQLVAEQKVKTVIERINTGRYHTIAFARLDEFWILGADTVVFLDGAILGKAPDENVARGMLESISGRTHKVLTGVFAGKVGREIEGGFMLQESTQAAADTEVMFKSLSAGEISWYLATGEWRGAAGAYRIQGKGACLVTGINGSFSNVVGLPIETIYGMLVWLGYSFESG